MKKIITVIATLVPSMALAQTTIIDAGGLTNRLTSLANTFISILITLAFIFIIWHVVMYIIKASDEVARKAHRSGVIWGIVGLAIILSIWGLVNILVNTFRTDNNVYNAPVIKNYNPSGYYTNGQQ